MHDIDSYRDVRDCLCMSMQGNFKRKAPEFTAMAHTQEPQD